MIDLSRATDAAVLNSIVNDPAIYPWVHGQVVGDIDLSAVVANPANHCLIASHGAIVFGRHQFGLYEAHVQVLPAGRGPWALEFAQSAAHWQFTRTEAMEIFMRVPKGNLAARALARRLGAKFQFTAPRGWMLGEECVPADIYSRKVEDWLSDAPGLEEAGAQFRAMLGDEYRRLGRDLIWQSDPLQDRYIGGAVEMIRGGQPDKGVVMWNRFAVMANHPTIQIAGRDPTMICIGPALLELHGRSFFIASLASHV